MPGGARPAETMKALLGMPLDAPADGSGAAATGTALRVTVLNGDLTFVRQPLLVGHYRSDGLTGTEWVIDRMVGGAMTVSLSAGLYPQAADTHQIFINNTATPDNPWRAPRPIARCC